MTPQMFNNGYGTKEPGFSNMIVLSLVAHLIVITIVFVSVPTTSRHLTFGPVYSVSLVSPEVVLPRNQESSIMKEIEKSADAGSSVVFKKEMSRSVSTPVKKEETNKVNIEKAISAIKQKEPIPEASAPVMAAGRAVPSTGVKVSGSEVNAQRQEYIGVVWAKIQKNWSLPPTLVPKENIEAVIAVRIARSGGLEFVNFEKRSGNSYFDDAALKTVKKSSPFPPFPARLTDGNIEIGIRFHSAQFR